MKICDFCSAPNPTWAYPCKDFIDATGIGNSIGYWAACDICHDLIEQHQPSQLAIRGMETLDVGVTPIEEPFVLAYLKDLHTKFSKNRTGPPFKISS